MNVKIFNTGAQQVEACALFEDELVEFSLSTISNPPEMRVFVKCASGGRDDMTHLFARNGESISPTLENLVSAYTLYSTCKPLLLRARK